jgi:hypothetical protein
MLLSFMELLYLWKRVPSTDIDLKWPWTTNTYLDDTILFPKQSKIDSKMKGIVMSSEFIASSNVQSLRK